MASRVFEEARDFRVGLVEAEPVEAASACYPLPALRPSNRVETRTLGVVVLENEFLRATIAPDLGGRVVSLLDRRFERELLPGDALVPTPGGPRGVELRHGVEIALDGRSRPNSMGRVSFELDEPGDEEDAAGVWCAETSLHGGLSVHWHFSLAPGEFALRIEVRVANRSYEARRYNGGLLIHGTDLALLPDSRFAFAHHCRFAGEATLGARQADVWRACLVPIEGGATHVASTVALRLAPEGVRVQSVRPMPGGKLVLRTEDGRSLEAPADLDPERPLEIPLDGLKPSALALLDGDRREVLRTDVSPPIAAAVPNPGLSASVLENAKGELESLLAHTALRGPAASGLSRQALRRGDFAEAGRLAEDALLYNGDDPLTWWQLAIAKRLAGDEDPTPLMNAHYLAPLEPLLRAEAFLAQGPAQGKEPNPLVTPLAHIPEDLVEVAAVLVDHGLADEAARWIDEALRHVDLAMLRYLMAFLLLRETRMEAEAANHVAAARRAQLPPMPWRPIEHEAIRALAERFPQDERLARLISVAPSPSRPAQTSDRDEEGARTSQ
jgi:hypothetical protein